MPPKKRLNPPQGCTRLDSFGFIKRPKPNAVSAAASSATVTEVDTASASTSVSSAAPAPVNVTAPAATARPESPPLDLDCAATQPPQCWGPSQWTFWKNKYSWLFAKEGCIGCLPCKNAKTLLNKSFGAHLAEQWMNGTVSSPQSKKLRKKIYLHSDSVAHKQAIDIERQNQKEVLPKKVSEITSALLKETASSFRAAYTVAKERLPYTKLNPLMTLNELNGATVGPAHRSDHSCAQIIEHIATEMKKKCVSHVKSND